ncbi:MAG: AsnC family transcriptional regulator [Azonexus sp.]|jgi:DNA-binding Lrp family transcriptional regulator|nr:AsnC family transcriptional regulator [Azonexus sp.]HRF29002.1 AsnC family transcriptional regulator [Azonexus sp.]
MPELSDIDRQILATLQGDFPICERPYAEAAAQLGIGEAELLARLESLLADKVLTRFGPMFQIEEMGGAFVLAALAVPEARYEEVTALVNALPQVAHNYRREHQLNMWFVLATESKAGIAEAIAQIEHDTGLPVYAFPKEREFFVEMKLEARL